MKRINILPIVAVIIVACSKLSLEDRARERVKPLTEIIVSDPNSLIIQEVKAVISNDSLCVLQYLAKSKNRFGGYETSKMEYYMVRGVENKNEWYECAYDLKDHPTLKQSVREFERGFENRLRSKGFEPPKVDSNITAFTLAHTVNILLDTYRKVE